jgi:hypothetical protein
VVVVSTGSARGVYPLAAIARRSDADGVSTAVLDGTTLQFLYWADPETVAVAAVGDGGPVKALHTFWFAWHAMHPEDEPALR